MTPDEERRQALREAVLAFRLAVAVLENPAPTLFTDLAVPEVVRNLGREPALASFSPFDALPDDAAYGRGERVRQPAGLPRGISDRRHGRETARGGSRQTLPSWTGEPVAEPPSFSFRRSGASGIPAGERDRDLEDDPRRTSQGDFHVPEPTRRDREESAAAETRPDRHVRLYPGATNDGGGTEVGAADPAPGERRSVYPMTLLSDLARAAFDTAEPRIQEDFVRPSGSSTPWSVGLQEPAGGGTGHYGAGDHTRGEPDLGAYDNGAVALIGSLADHLLTPEDRVARGLPKTEVPDGGATQSVAARVREQHGEEMVMDSPPSPFSGAKDRGTAGRSGSNWLDANPIALASDRHTEAETFAALVNEVLVRQARRHGVDLS